jgi:hypothetical protein
MTVWPAVASCQTQPGAKSGFFGLPLSSGSLREVPLRNGTAHAKPASGCNEEGTP